MTEQIHINVPTTEQEKQRIVNEENSWTAPKLIALMLGTLGISLIVLYMMANM